MRAHLLLLFAAVCVAGLASASDVPPVGAYVGTLEGAGVQLRPGERVTGASRLIPTNTIFRGNRSGAPNFGIELRETGVDCVREAKGEAVLEDVGGAGTLYLDFAGDVLVLASSISGHLSIRNGYLMGAGVTYNPTSKSFSPVGAEVVQFRGTLELAATASGPEADGRPALVAKSRISPKAATVMTVDSDGRLQSTDELAVLDLFAPSMKWVPAIR